MYPKVYLYKRIKDAKILLDRRFCDDVRLDEIAEDVYLSKYHFTRLFKRAYGITPHQYLMQKRIELAKKLLQSNRPAYQVCYDVGFQSVTSFSNLFKRQTGTSPGKFGKQASRV